MTEERLLIDAARRAQAFRDQIATRRVAPDPAAVKDLEHLAGALPEGPTDPHEVLRELDRYGTPATVANAGGRYFGFVIGGGVPVALAANYLANAWNQNAAAEVMSPVATRLEAISVGWIRELLDLPAGAHGAFVSGETLANVAALAAARHAVLERAGWDVERDGLAGAPPVRVVVGEEAHASVLRALTFLGFGREGLLRVPTDAQGRMRPEGMPALKGPSIVCVQAGNVNTGAFDPAREIGERTRAEGAWLHVDGAFGLWARAAPGRRALADGIELADSWALDGHKWLNLPYDSGLVYVRDGAPLRAALAGGPAAYLPSGGRGEPYEYTPEMSRRARGIDAWAALRSLGRAGVAELVERCCRLAGRAADRLRAGGARILNDVVLNQVLVDFGDAERTRRTIEAVQEEGTAWCGGTVWHGTTAMRISVSSWATTEADIDRAAAAILRLAARPGRAPPDG